MIAPRTLTACALALGLSLAARPAVAETPPAKDTPKMADVRRLLQLTGAAQLGAQVMEQLIPAFKQQMPSVPDRFWQDFMKEANPNELVNQVAIIYDKYLSHDEVKAIIKFYETPAGKKLVSVLPQVTQESMVIGQQWGKQLGERVMRKLQQEQQGKKAK